MNNETEASIGFIREGCDLYQTEVIICTFKQNE